MVELTEKLLMDAGGWQAMKEARAMWEAGKVIEASYEQPVLAGRVRGADGEFRAGLRVASRMDIENTCTCTESRKRGLVCAHSLAVGVAVIRGLKQSEAPGGIARTKPVEGAAGDANFSPDGAGPLAKLHVILPPNFAAAWEKKSLMIVCEIEVSGARKPLGAVGKDEQFQAGGEDLRLIAKLRSFCGGKLPAMAMMTRPQLLELLGVLVGHPRVTFGKAHAAEIRENGIRETLRIERLEDGSLQMTCTTVGGALLVAGASAWRLVGTTFTQVALGLPAPYLPLLEGAITIPPEGADTFSQRELPLLASFFEIEGDIVPTQPAEAPAPEFSATFEGSLNFLTARLEAVYGERRVTLDASGAALAKFQRNRAAEHAAVEGLRNYGFDGPNREGEFILKGEQRILAFFAAGLPRLQREWKVSVGERFTHVTRQVERIEPRLEVRSSGEQWFDLSYDLATAGGDRFSSSEISRLLHGGQSHVRGRNGKLAVFDPGLLDDFSQFLRDSAPRQTEAGIYRMDRRQAGALHAFAEDNCLAIGGASRWREWAVAPRNLERLQALPLGPLDSVLRDYQRHGVYWLHFLAQNGLGGILADEMGLGKTLQTLAFLSTLTGQGPSLVVCPSSLVFNWKAEAERWTPNLRVLALEGARRMEDFGKIGNSDLVITSYALIRRDIDSYESVEFCAVILDEAQHIKNPDSQNANAATALNAKHRFVLTGTPVENSVRDIWSLMHFLMPGYLGTRTEFRERYESAIQNNPRGSEQQRLLQRIRPFLLRRTKAKVAKELPEKQEQVIYCQMTKIQTELYSSLAQAVKKEIAEFSQNQISNKARNSIFTSLLRLRQASCDTRLLGHQEDDMNQKPETSGKLELLEELLSEIIDGGHKALVFSQFVSMLGFIRNHLDALGVAYCYLDGQSHDRAEQVRRFQSGATPVFLISLKAGGTGLNLTAADTVIHFDPWWNPAVEAQATDRAHRIGQDRMVRVYRLITKETVEEKILRLQAKKRSVIEATIESDAAIVDALTMDEIRELVE